MIIDISLLMLFKMFDNKVGKKLYSLSTYSSLFKNGIGFIRPAADTLGLVEYIDKNSLSLLEMDITNPFQMGDEIKLYDSNQQPLKIINVTTTNNAFIINTVERTQTTDAPSLSSNDSALLDDIFNSQSWAIPKECITPELLKDLGYSPVKDKMYRFNNENIKSYKAMKIGRLISKLFPDTFLPHEIELFVDIYKSNYGPEISQGLHFELVKGKDILKWYNGDHYVDNCNNSSLGRSCMRHGDLLKAASFYANNENCSMLILLDEKTKVVGRAIIWHKATFEDSIITFMDRVYTSNQSYEAYFIKFAKRLKWDFKEKQSFDHVGYCHYNKDTKSYVKFTSNEQKNKKIFIKIPYSEFPNKETSKFITPYFDTFSHLVYTLDALYLVNQPYKFKKYDSTSTTFLEDLKAQGVEVMIFRNGKNTNGVSSTEVIDDKELGTLSYFSKTTNSFMLPGITVFKEVITGKSNPQVYKEFIQGYIKSFIHNWPTFAIIDVLKDFLIHNREKIFDGETLNAIDRHSDWFIKGISMTDTMKEIITTGLITHYDYPE